MQFFLANLTNEYEVGLELGSSGRNMEISSQLLERHFLTSFVLIFRSVFFWNIFTFPETVANHLLKFEGLEDFSKVTSTCIFFWGGMRSDVGSFQGVYHRWGD